MLRCFLTWAPRYLNPALYTRCFYYGNIVVSNAPKTPGRTRWRFNAYDIIDKQGILKMPTMTPPTSIAQMPTSITQLFRNRTVLWQQMLASRHWMKARLCMLKQVRAPQPLQKRKGKCWYCGRCRHPRQLCPARNAICFKCSIKGHSAQVCREANPSRGISAAMEKPVLQGLRPETNFISGTQVLVYINVNGITAETLVDTGSMFCHISETFQRLVRSPLGCSTKQIGLAVKGCVSKCRRMRSFRADRKSWVS